MNEELELRVEKAFDQLSNNEARRTRSERRTLIALLAFAFTLLLQTGGLFYVFGGKVQLLDDLTRRVQVNDDTIVTLTARVNALEIAAGRLGRMEGDIIEIKGDIKSLLKDRP